MFRFTKPVLQPPSSTMFRPSTRRSLLIVGAPLMVIAAAEVHVAKSRFRFVSWTPGRMASMAYMSRPFT